MSIGAGGGGLNYNWRERRERQNWRDRVCFSSSLWEKNMSFWDESNLKGGKKGGLGKFEVVERWWWSQLPPPPYLW